LGRNHRRVVEDLLRVTIEWDEVGAFLGEG
jgi:hypothetical protein